MGEGESSISASLLVRVQAYDPAAWRRLVDLYAPLVYGWCRKAHLQEADAADVGQEVFRAVHRAIGRFHKDQKGDTFRGWLRRIVQNKLRDFLRNRLAKPAAGVGGSEALARLQQAPTDQDVESALAPSDSETQELTHRVLNLIRSEFKDRDWQAFWRVAVDGQPAAQVANDLGVTVNVVYLAKSRIVKRVRAEFADLLDEAAPSEETPGLL